MPESAVLALDVGEVRIGVAIANPPVFIARPLVTILNSTDVTQEIKKLVVEQGVEHVVIGLPRGLNGQETAQTAKAQAFAAEIGRQLNIAYTLQDEAATSIKAEAELNARKKPYEKSDIDALAATFILEDYLKEVLHV